MINSVGVETIGAVIKTRHDTVPCIDLYVAQNPRSRSIQVKVVIKTGLDPNTDKMVIMHYVT